MTAKEFVRAFSGPFHVTVDAAETWFKCICEFLADAIVSEDYVRLPGIGTFKKDYIFPRTRFDLKTGQNIEAPGRMTIKFVIAKSLDDRLRALPCDPSLADSGKMRRREKMDLPYRIEGETVDGQENSASYDSNPGETSSD